MMALTLRHFFMYVIILQAALVGVYFVVRGTYTLPRTSLIGSLTSMLGPTAMIDQLIQNGTSFNSSSNRSLLEAAMEKRRACFLPRLQKEKTGNATTQRLPLNSTNRPIFQSVDDEAAWVYSAFFDYVDAENGDPVIRVFALFKNECLFDLFCFLTVGDETLTSGGSVVLIPDSHGTKHVPVDVKCPLSGNIRPTYVSISFEADQEPTNRLQIQYPGPRIRNFTVCYSILNSGYNSAMQLIENIEMNRILGAEHLMVYTYSVSPVVEQILNRYQQDGIMTVFKWPLPTTDTWYFGQTLALNDCTYRNRNTSRFVVVVDTDEIVVPRAHKSWMELIHAVSPHEQDVSRLMNASSTSEEDNNQTACFMVRSCYFTIDWVPKWKRLPPQLVIGKAEQLNVRKYGMKVLSQHWRHDTVLKPRDRSKYIGRPERILYAGIHFPRNFTTNTSCLVMNENLGIVHHYRTWYKSPKYIIDTSVLKHKDALYQNIMTRVLQFPTFFINQ